MHELEHRYYRPSGTVPATSTVLMLLIGMAASLVLGLVFELIKHYLVHEVIQVVSSIGFGALVGLSVYLSARLAHVRNPKFAMFVGFVIGLFAVYIAWALYLWINLKFQWPVLRAALTQPKFLWGWIQIFAKVGPWKLFDWHPKGGTLYAVWAVEALMIVGFAVGVSAVGSPTYCEACGKWTKKVDLLLHVPMIDPEPLKADLEAENYEPLYRLVGKPFNMVQRTDITAVQCPTCTDSNFLTVALTNVSHNGQQEVVQIEPIVKHLIVPIDVIETLQGRQPVEGESDDGNPNDQIPMTN